MTRWIRIRWPERFKGHPRRVADLAGLVARPHDDHWRFATVAGYHRRPESGFLSLSAVVGPGLPFGEDAQRVAARWEVPPGIGDGTDSRVNAQVSRLLHTDTEGDPDLEEFLDAIRLLFMTQGDARFRAWLADGLPEALAKSLPDYRLGLISLSGHVHGRVAFARGMFSALHGREWFGETNDFQGFNSMRGLFGDGFQGSTTFLHPMLAAHSPWMFGAAASRPPNAMALILFGAVVPGRGPLLHSDLCQALSTNYLASGQLVRAAATPDIPVDDALDTARWWIRGLDRLFGVALDPTLFVDEDDWYRPADHIGYLVSLDRLFASVIASLVHTGSDEYSRRIHLFEALDLYEGIGMGGYDVTLHVVRLGKYLKELRAQMPESVAHLLLPRCEAAVNAVEDLRDGFHHDRLTSGKVSVIGKQGEASELPVADATSRYLRVIRNAGHSLTRGLENPVSLSLLSAHDGSIPGEISDVSFLHLVRLIAESDLLSRPLLGRRDGPVSAGER